MCLPNSKSKTPDPPRNHGHDTGKSSLSPLMSPPSALREVRGARNWAKGALAFSRAARFARPALVNGAVGVVMAPRGRLFRALSFTITRGKIVQIDVVADPERLRQLDLAVLND